MYKIEQNEEAVIVYGPDGFQRRLLKSAVGIVLRQGVGEPWDDTPRPFTIKIGKMTDEEVVACALGIEPWL
jgi:hypothetical protein